MAHDTDRGFTIIEVLLFLAVSGALFAALMIGVGSNIVQQQYRQSVTSYGALLQQQYSQAINISDQRDNGWVCNDSVATQQPNGGQARGTTDCVLLGRIIQIQDSGTSVKTSTVIGEEPSDYRSQSDIATLLAYKPKVAAFDSETTAIDWGSSLVTTDHQPSMATIMILRSPASGLVRVFASPSSQENIAALITPENATTVLKNCVKGQTLLQPTQSVSVNPRIAGPDGVSVAPC